jgi:hypothetical protein
MPCKILFPGPPCPAQTGTVGIVIFKLFAKSCLAVQWQIASPDSPPGGYVLIVLARTAGRKSDSDLRNHQAIVQPRLYDSLMVMQITLKTEAGGCNEVIRRRQVMSDAIH